MPVVAAIIVRLSNLHPPVGMMIVALALAPLPPILPNKETKAGGDAAFAISLLVTSAQHQLDDRQRPDVQRHAEESADHLHRQRDREDRELTTVFLPLGAGLVIRRFLPAIAEKLSDPLSKIATLLLVVAALAVLFGARKGMIAQIGDGTLLALATFIVVGLIVGHLLGGPHDEHRTVLALSTASRHPGITLALIHIAFPDARKAGAATLSDRQPDPGRALRRLAQEARRQAPGGVTPLARTDDNESGSRHPGPPDSPRSSDRRWPAVFGRPGRSMRS